MSEGPVWIKEKGELQISGKRLKYPTAEFAQDRWLPRTAPLAPREGFNASYSFDFVEIVIV